MALSYRYDGAAPARAQGSRVRRFQLGMRVSGCRARDRPYPTTIRQIASGGARDMYAVRNACNAKTVCGLTATIVTMERAAATGNGDPRIAVPIPPWQMRQCSWSIGGAVWPGCLPLEPPPISNGQRTPAAITMPESPAAI